MDQDCGAYCGKLLSLLQRLLQNSARAGDVAETVLGHVALCSALDSYLPFSLLHFPDFLERKDRALYLPVHQHRDVICGNPCSSQLMYCSKGILSGLQDDVHTGGGKQARSIAPDRLKSADPGDPLSHRIENGDSSFAIDGYDSVVRTVDYRLDPLGTLPVNLHELEHTSGFGERLPDGLLAGLDDDASHPPLLGQFGHGDLAHDHSCAQLFELYDPLLYLRLV